MTKAGRTTRKTLIQEAWAFKPLGFWEIYWLVLQCLRIKYQKKIFDILIFNYQILRRPVDWPKALQSLSSFLKKSWRAPVRHHSTCSVIKSCCHFLFYRWELYLEVGRSKWHGVVVSKVESQLPLGFNSEVESYLYPRFNLGQLSVVKVRGWLNLLGIVLASKNEHLLIF